jgi:hypothetical protein
MSLVAAATNHRFWLQTLFVPAVISLLIFLFLTFVIVPVWRRYRNRYSQYLPVESISNHTSGLRHHIVNRFSRLTLPSTWSRNRGAVDNAGADDFLEDGEELNDVDEQTLDAIQRLNSHLGAGPDSNRRLSRE